MHDENLFPEETVSYASNTFFITIVSFVSGVPAYIKDCSAAGSRTSP
jgi:hypothetical protein